MKLQDACDHYTYFSGEASKLTRQFALAAVGVIWLFKAELPNGGGVVIPRQLLLVAAIAVCGLALDFTQYVYGSLFWSWFHRIKERELGRGSTKDFGVQKEANWPTIGCFWLKAMCVAVAYVVLLTYLIPKLWH